jgi:hypothetical protein
VAKLPLDVIPNVTPVATQLLILPTLLVAILLELIGTLLILLELATRLPATLELAGVLLVELELAGILLTFTLLELLLKLGGTLLLTELVLKLLLLAEGITMLETADGRPVPKALVAVTVKL